MERLPKGWQTKRRTKNQEEGAKRRLVWDSPLPTRVPLRDPSAEEELQLSRSLWTRSPERTSTRLIVAMRSSRLLRGTRAIGATVNLMQFDNRPAQIARSIRVDLSTWRCEKMEHHDETEVSWEAHDVLDDVVRLLLAQVHGSNHGLAGQWKCALLYARYTPDRTGYGQTADIWSWESAPALFTHVQNSRCKPSKKLTYSAGRLSGEFSDMVPRDDTWQGTHQHDRKPRYLVLVWFKCTFILEDGINMNFCATMNYFEYFLKRNWSICKRLNTRYELYLQLISLNYTCI